MPHRRPRLAFALVAALVAPAAGAEDPVPGVAVTGGVADPPNKVVYLSDPAGGVVAADLDTGAVRWASKAVTRPVAARADGEPDRHGWREGLPARSPPACARGLPCTKQPPLR